MKRIFSYIADHALALAGLIVAVLALAGGSYAALTSGSGAVRAWALISPSGHVVRSGGGPHVAVLAGVPGGYNIHWRAPLGRRCATEVTIDSALSPPTETVTGSVNAQLTAGYGVAASSSGKEHGRPLNATVVHTFNQQGQPTALGFDVVVIC